MKLPNGTRDRYQDRLGDPDETATVAYGNASRALDLDLAEPLDLIADRLAVDRTVADYIALAALDSTAGDR